MEKKFSKIEINTIKTIAKNVAPYVAKKQKKEEEIAQAKADIEKRMQELLEKKVAKIQAEKESLQQIIDSMNATVKTITGGYTTEDLVNCVKEGTGKMDDKGKEIFQTRYVLKYPETVIPVENTESAEGTETPASKEAPAEAASEEHQTEEVPEEQLAQDAQVQQEAEQNSDPFADGDGWN